jgi:hypothetical protein
MLIDLETEKEKETSAFRNMYQDLIIRIVEG